MGYSCSRARPFCEQFNIVPLMFHIDKGWTWAYYENLTVSCWLHLPMLPDQRVRKVALT
jgi:hypothetical protein